MFNGLLSDPVSLIWSVLTILAAFIFCGVLSKFKNQFEGLNEDYEKEKSRNTGKTAFGEKNPETGKHVLIRTEEEVSVKYMDQIEDKYNNIFSKYNAWSQSISLFPMSGILGTVFGLMLQISQSDLEQITGSIGVALLTTFWALICAIILKIYDATVGIASDRIYNVINAYARGRKNASMDAQIDKEVLNEQTK